MRDSQIKKGYRDMEEKRKCINCMSDMQPGRLYAENAALTAETLISRFMHFPVIFFCMGGISLEKYWDREALALHMLRGTGF